MEYDLEYIKYLKTDELVDIISNIWGFEETSGTLLELERRDLQKALHLGMEILENNKGDDYLQASVWDFIFSIDPENVLNCLDKRKEKLGKVLLYDILQELNGKFYIKDIKCLPKTIIRKIFQAYNEFVEEEDSELKKEFIEFSNSVV